MKWHCFQISHQKFSNFSKFVLFLVLPFGIAHWLFWFQVNIPLKQETDTEGKKWFVLDNKKFAYPDLKNSIRRVFQAPFDLTYYEICFVNATNAVENQTTEYLPVEINFTFIDPKVTDVRTLNIKAGGRECLYLNTKTDQISYDVTTIYHGHFFPLNFTINHNVLPENPKPIIGDQIVSSVIFTIAWWSFLLLIRELYHVLWSKKRPHVPT